MNAAVAGTGCLLICAAGFTASTHAATPRVTFNRDIAPIVLNYCAPCYRPGESGPINLLNYDDVKKRARQIAR